MSARRSHPQLNTKTGQLCPWHLKDLRKTFATCYDERIPEFFIEIPGHAVGGITDLCKGSAGNYDDLDRVVEAARASSLLTQGHPAAMDSAAAAAMMVAIALHDATPQQMFDEIEKRCCYSSADFAETWRKIPAMLALPPEHVLTKNVLGEG